MTASEIKDISEFVSSVFHSESTYNQPQPITPEEAAITLSVWTEEELCFPPALTPDLFSKTWNILCDRYVATENYIRSWK